MATKVSTKTTPDTYFKLVRQFPLTHIESEAHAEQAINVINELLKCNLDHGSQMYLDALTDLVMVWEDESIHFRRVPGVEILQELMREHGLTQSELSRKTGIAQSTLSAILAGGRSITVKHAEIFGKYFATGAGAFLPV